MTVQDSLEYAAAFRPRWNDQVALDLLSRFRLDRRQRTSHLSKGQKTQLALTTAIASQPELLVLDEPTSGLDPIVRREFIQTVIGAYQEGGGQRTVFVSTHLISEFEGLIDEFTIIDGGREVATLESDVARQRFQKIHARFAAPAPEFDLQDALRLTRRGREIEAIVEAPDAAVTTRAVDRIRAASPESLTVESLSLEEIFVATLVREGNLV